MGRVRIIYLRKLLNCFCTHLLQLHLQNWSKLLRNAKMHMHQLNERNNVKLSTFNWNWLYFSTERILFSFNKLVSFISNLVLFLRSSGLFVLTFVLMLNYSLAIYLTWKHACCALISLFITHVFFYQKMSSINGSISLKYKLRIVILASKATIVLSWHLRSDFVELNRHWASKGRYISITW